MVIEEIPVEGPIFPIGPPGRIEDDAMLMDLRVQLALDGSRDHVVPDGPDKSPAPDELHAVKTAARPAGHVLKVGETGLDGRGGHLLENPASPLVVHRGDDAGVLDQAMRQVEPRAAALVLHVLREGLALRRKPLMNLAEILLLDVAEKAEIRGQPPTPLACPGSQVVILPGHFSVIINAPCTPANLADAHVHGTPLGQAGSTMSTFSRNWVTFRSSRSIDLASFGTNWS